MSKIKIYSNNKSNILVGSFCRQRNKDLRWKGGGFFSPACIEEPGQYVAVQQMLTDCYDKAESCGKTDL